MERSLRPAFLLLLPALALTLASFVPPARAGTLTVSGFVRVSGVPQPEVAVEAFVTPICPCFSSYGSGGTDASGYFSILVPDVLCSFSTPCEVYVLSDGEALSGAMFDVFATASLDGVLDEFCDGAIELDLEGSPVPVKDPGVESPPPFALAVRPNPAPGWVRVTFETPEAARATVQVIDVAGRILRTLLDEARPRGEHGLFWDGTTGDGDPVPNGIVFLRVQVGDAERIEKIVLAR